MLSAVEHHLLGHNYHMPISDLSLKTLQRLCLGMTSKEIASMEGTSPRTVDARIARLCERMGAVSRIELVVLAIRRGLVT